MRKEHLFTLMIVLLPMLQAEWHYRHPLQLVPDFDGAVKVAYIESVSNRKRRPV